MKFKFNENERTMIRTLMRDAGLHAAKLDHKDLYKYSKRIMQKFQGDSFFIDLKLADISNICSLTRAGSKILNESYTKKDEIDKEIESSEVETDEAKIEKEEQIKENEVLFEMNRVQVSILTDLTKRLELIEIDLKQNQMDRNLDAVKRSRV